MKFIIAILLSFIFFQAEYQHTFQNKDFIIKYNFEKKDNKTYMIGHIVFQKNNKNAINTNLMVIDHQIGAVPNG
ncbi:hypothetical protein [Marivirga sp.]|uniref:hypothetical protein n=1 Tax=Marivirga sp. TaxID=2018662 RepID=UPI002D7E7E7F|nr:hypothetical protein [Marivirga sp.]HET8859466.1 hypothetical protein [Marivirga sp.]